MKRYIASLLSLLVLSGLAWAQSPAASDEIQPQELESDIIEPTTYESLVDSLIGETVIVDTLMSSAPLPRKFFLPMVYGDYALPSLESPFRPDLSGNPAMRWVEDYISSYRRANEIAQSVAINYPWVVKLNTRWLPDPPKEFKVTVNPEEHTIAIVEIINNPITATTLEADAVQKRHWIREFNASLQFSQAYVSPNWYQGGNNNLNMLLNLYYNVKLTQAFHPKLLFETTFQYKLGMNSVPDDTIRSYNISDDILQINSVFGVKAFKKWYYSVNAVLKTQVLNGYPSNSSTLRSAFLSPGELNVGVGMTYGTANAKKTFTFDASISPLSYNLKTCINDRLDPTAFGIDAGKKFKSNYGSSIELKLFWQMAHNIWLRSRLFAFTDYGRAYADWENTISFEINRFLTTTLYAHARYDTQTPPTDNPHWHKLQLKEILSLGFAYKFSTI